MHSEVQLSRSAMSVACTSIVQAEKPNTAVAVCMPSVTFRCNIAVHRSSPANTASYKSVCMTMQTGSAMPAYNRPRSSPCNQSDQLVLLTCFLWRDRGWGRLCWRACQHLRRCHCLTHRFHSLSALRCLSFRLLVPVAQWAEGPPAWL